jgi:hypothetical protein
VWFKRDSATERVAMPHPLLWTLTTALLVGLAVAAAVAPKPADTADPKVPAPLPGWVPDRLSWLSSDDLPTVLHAATALFAVAAVLALRRTLFAFLVARPGAIEIVLSGRRGGPDGGPGGSTPDEEVLAHLRRRLSNLSLSAPQSVPNEPSAESVLDGVKSAANGTGNALATVAAVTRAVLQVRYGYRASLQLHERTGPEPHGITVTVAVLPTGRAQIASIWADDWEDLAEQAAHLVGAYVIPRSRLSRRAPWKSWRGLELPPDLFHESQLARQHVIAREYERAIAAYHRALKTDPQNPYLRIELAQTQEQLGLFMDALAGYADVVAIESWYDRRVWWRLRYLLRDNYDSSGQPPSRFRRSPSGRDALLIARFRLVGRLAAAEQLADQWRRVVDNPESEDRNPRRSAERRALAQRLIVWLRSYWRNYRKDPDRQHLGPFDDTVFADRLRLRHFLQYVADHEARLLIDDYRWSRLRRWPGMSVTQTSLKTMRVWAPLYLAKAEFELDPDTKPHWKRPPARLGEDLEQALRPKPARLREWQEHYMAACTFAVALSGWPPDSKAYRQLSLRAVRHLERAVSCSESAYVGRFAQWLSTGDQDLNPLRATFAFVDYLDRYLPNPEHRVERPKDLLRLLMSMHTMRLLYGYAHLRAGYWEDEQRRLQGGSPIDRQELGREAEARRIARSYLLDDRDWYTRTTLIDEQEAFARRHGLHSPGSTFPQFQEDPAVQRHALSRSEGTGDSPGPDYPDGYYREIIEGRRLYWRKLLDSLPEPVDVTPGGDLAALTRSIIESARFWRWLATALDGALRRDAFGEVPSLGRTSGATRVVVRARVSRLIGPTRSAVHPHGPG